MTLQEEEVEDFALPLNVAQVLKSLIPFTTTRTIFTLQEEVVPESHEEEEQQQAAGGCCPCDPGIHNSHY